MNKSGGSKGGQTGGGQSAASGSKAGSPGRGRGPNGFAGGKLAEHYWRQVWRQPCERRTGWRQEVTEHHRVLCGQGLLPPLVSSSDIRGDVSI
jgi:hypothetical protein